VLTVPEETVRIERSERPWLYRATASLREIVCTTIECVRINAASILVRDGYPRLRYLGVEIEGWEAGEDLSGTYPLEGAQPVSAHRADCE
jgi:hypothetical protein